MNLDSTTLRLVKKGKRVRLGDLRGVVVKVSRGNCLVLWGGEQYPRPYACAELTVI